MPDKLVFVGPGNRHFYIKNMVSSVRIYIVLKKVQILTYKYWY